MAQLFRPVVAMIIVCPHCQTRYQVARSAIGAVGRKVVCAQCTGAWQALDVYREEDTMFGPAEEHRLDREFEAQERIERARRAVPVSAKEPPVSPPSPIASAEPMDQDLLHRMQRDYFRRETSLWRRLPFARLRRAGRLSTLSFVCVTVAAFWLQRTELVRAYPDLAGLYASMGLPVNVVGLEFSDFSSMRSQRGGTDLIEVHARIRSVASANIAVPGIIVTMLDRSGKAIYEWSVDPQTKRIEPGAEIDFSTELPSPPAEATHVRLTFTTGRVQSAINDSPNLQGAR